MSFMPFSPRWLVEKGRDNEALRCLSTLRRKPANDTAVRYEFLEIMAEVRYSREIAEVAYPNASKFQRIVNNYLALVSSWPKFKRLMVGCLTMFYQQFMVSFE